MQLTNDNSILQTLRYLQEQFGKDCFQIEDHWNADLSAIGLTDRAGNYLLYPITYRKEPGTLYLEVEEKINPPTTKVVFDNATRSQ